MMADGDLSPDDEAAAQSLIDELLEQGFEYTSNGRVAGFAAAETDPEEPDDPEEPEEPAADPAAAEDPEEADPPETDDPGRGAHTGRLELRGTPLTEAEADGLLHMRKLLIDHPELATRFNELAAEKLTGTPAPPPPPAAEATVDDPTDELPDYIDPNDEVSVGLWNQIQEIKKGQAQTRDTVVHAVDQAGRAKVQADIANAVDRFKAAHPDLDDTDIAAIRDHTAASVNVQNVMANFPGDPVEGLVRALEIGSMTDPATRDKVLGVKDDRSKKDATRQKALSALSGGSGGGNRRRPAPAAKPAGWSDVAKQLASELEKLGGN